MQVSFQTPRYNLLVDFNATKCAKKIIERFPLDSEIRKWSEGVYFKTDVDFAGEDFAKHIDVGDVVYWPEGKIIAIFFGTMPMSVDEVLIPVWKLIKIGQIKVDISGFQSINESDKVQATAVEKEEEVVTVDSVPDPDRKLSQSEIDVLVQKLLAQKKN